MKLSASCLHPLTKKRWNPEHLVSVLLLPLHCEGKAFHGNSPNLIQVPLVAKISSMVEGVCARARMCVSVCVSVCLCGRVRDYQQTMITVAFRGVPDAHGSLCLRFLVSQLRQARAAIVLGFVKCTVKILNVPHPSHAFTILASPVAPP